MAAFATFNEKTQEFLTYASNGVRSRSLLSSVAVARALSNRLPVSVGIQENLGEFYKNTCEFTVRSLLSKLNELISLDVDLILVYTEKFYQVRHYAVNPPECVYCSRAETAVTDFFGLSFGVSGDVVDQITGAPVEATKLYNGFQAMITELLAVEN